MNIAVQCHVFRPTHQWHEHKDKNHSSANKEPSADQSSKSVDDFIEGESSHNSNCQHDTGHIDRCSNELGIVKTSDLDLANGECQDESDDLKHHLVAVQDTQKDTARGGVTDVDIVVGYNILFLKK